ncbi:glycosyltransferase family 4 protein [uncultured Bacteroides sp.]|uniref:glycosyltransferase family 4 protein n=1 Tax=uncultured Bacteroides sp. TaxID=162156 RepID=UPI0025E3AB67|nr:glycosyltransferase [uncultured Bacteroides sp.]
MRIYYYHTRPIQEALDEWENHLHPGHILYGLTHFSRHGITPILHRYRHFASRLRFSLYNFFEIIRCKEPYDLLYGTSFYGLELVIFLRALGLYRKPIAIWHHQAVVRNSGKLKNLISRFYYKGIDQMFFFSRALIDDSLKSGKVSPEQLHLIHWGADLPFYDHLKQHLPATGRQDGEPSQDKAFISTGKENRDFATLLKAFAETGLPIDIFTTPDRCYEQLLKQYASHPNIHAHFTGGIIPHQLAVEVCRSKVVVICCLDFPYTVGLTTLVEAFALGLPVICSRNPKFGMDVEKEGAGIYVDYGDAEGWKQAITYLHTHPEEARRMGANGRKLAEREYNLEHYSRELSEILTDTVKTYRK